MPAQPCARGDDVEREVPDLSTLAADMTDLRATSRPMSPTVARRRLGTHLERLRGRRTQAEAARQLGFSLGKLKYLEWGTRPLSPHDLVDRVLGTYEVSEEEGATLIELCRQANERAWWEDYGDEDLTPDEKRYVGFEQGGTRMRDFQALLFPGLLQSAAYTESLVRHVSGASSEQVAALVEIRRRRQEVLHGPDPLVLHAIVDEAVLHRRAGSPEVMRAQLHHAADLAEQLPNVTLQVVPLDAGPHAGLGGSFNIIEFGWPDDAGAVFIEPRLYKTEVLDARRDVYRYSQVFDRLLQLALPGLESLKLLRNVAENRMKGLHHG